MLGYTAKLRIGAAGLALLGSSLLALAACQLIAGTDSREANPFPTACTFPSGKGLPQVRFANFVPDADVVDVCIRSAGGSWGEPIILGGGSDCTNPKKDFFAGSGLPQSKPATPGAAGIDYSQVTVPFSAPGPVVDVKVVLAGQNCSASALTEADGLEAEHEGGDDAPAHRWWPGHGCAPEKIEALGEVVTANPTGIDVRFVHAMPGVGPLDIGLGPSGVTALPTTLATPFPHGAGGRSARCPPPARTRSEGKPVTDDGIQHGGAAGHLQASWAGVHGTSPEKALLLEGISSRRTAPSTRSTWPGFREEQHIPAARGFLCDELQRRSNERNPLLANCAPTGLSGISVDVFTASLYGPNSPDFYDREKDDGEVARFADEPRLFPRLRHHVFLGTRFRNRHQVAHRRRRAR